MQQVNAAKKSPTGKAVRRIVDMLARTSPAASLYSSVAKAAKPKKKKPTKKSGASVSMCVGKMMYASVDPFHQNAQGACVPDGSSVASVRGFARKQITVTIGTAGVGFCLFFVPLGSDTPAFAYTTNTFVGTELSWLTANNTLRTGVLLENLPTNVTFGQLSSGWSASDDRPAFASRIVGAGFNFRYTGKEIDRAGQVYTYIHPQHSSAASSYDAGYNEEPWNSGDLAQFLETFIVETAREETFVPIMPINEAELAYSNEQNNNRTLLGYPFSQGADRQPYGFTYVASPVPTTVVVGIPICAAMFVGTPGSTYVINYGQHTETIGIGVNAYSRIPAESDPVGVQDLQSAFSRFSINRKRVPGANAVSEFKTAVASLQRDRNQRMAL